MAMMKERRARATLSYAYSVGIRAKKLLKLHKYDLDATTVLHLTTLAKDAYKALQMNRSYEDVVDKIEQRDLRRTKFTINLSLDLSKITDKTKDIIKELIQKEVTGLRAQCIMLAKQSPMISVTMRTYDEEYEDTEEEDIYSGSEG
jgi:hypothetical protein